MDSIRNELKKKIKELKIIFKKNERISEKSIYSSGLKNVTLRQYQVDGIKWLIDRYDASLGSILADEMGLGKTCQTISFLLYLNKERSKVTSIALILILVPLSTLNNWKNEFQRFAPSLKVQLLIGIKEERENLKRNFNPTAKKMEIILTTYEICLKDSSFLKKYEWNIMIVDEAHRLKNNKSLLYEKLKEFDIHHNVFLTGTPVQNNLEELYSLLSFVSPGIFNLKYLDHFLQEFKDVTSIDSSDLPSIIDHLILRRLKSQVMKDLPMKSEVILYHGLSNLQKTYYKALLSRNLDIFTKNGNRRNLMNVLMQLRKCVCHPYIFDDVEPEPFVIGEHLVEASGKLVILDKLLLHLKSWDHKVLIFSQMTRHLDIVQDYLAYRGFTYERLDGSVRAEERYRAMSAFNSNSETFAFLLSTKAGGQGLNLTGADTVIFLDHDFNPQNDLQAAARAHRIGQTKNVKVIRLAARDTVEEIILKRADKKLKLTKAVMTTSEDADDFALELEDILKFGLDKLFVEGGIEEEEIDFAQIIGPSLFGQWIETESTALSTSFEKADESSISLVSKECSAQTSSSSSSEDNIYMFEGRNYSDQVNAIGPSDADIQAFKQLCIVEEEARLKDEEKKIANELNSGGPFAISRARRSLKSVQKFEVLYDAPKKKLTKEQLDERRIKRELKREEEKRLRLEKDKKLEQLKKFRRSQLWLNSGYISANQHFSSSATEAESGLSSGSGDSDDGAASEVISSAANKINVNLKKNLDEDNLLEKKFSVTVEKGLDNIKKSNNNRNILNKNESDENNLNVNNLNENKLDEDSSNENNLNENNLNENNLNENNLNENNFDRNNSIKDKVVKNNSGEDNIDELDYEENDEFCYLNYVTGDVTRPIPVDNKSQQRHIKSNNNFKDSAIIVHCVDNSGKWRRGGLFNTLDALCNIFCEQYEMAGTMKDLYMGDVHIISTKRQSHYNDDDDDDDESNKHNTVANISSSYSHSWVALLVVQQNKWKKKINQIETNALDLALKKLGKFAKIKKASVHMPRIGINTPYNWYATERLIRKNLSNNHIPTYIYYYKRKSKVNASQNISSRQKRKVLPSSDEVGDNITLGPWSKKIKDNILPNFFSGVKIYLCQIDSNAGQTDTLKRHIIAYGGSVVDMLTKDVSHVVLPHAIRHPPNIIEKDYASLVMVNINWLKKCLTKKKLIDEAKYLITDIK